MSFKLKITESNKNHSFNEFLNELGHIVSENVNNNQKISTNGQELLQNIVPELIKQTSTLPPSQLSAPSLDAKDAQLLALKTIRVFLSTMISIATQPELANDEEVRSFIEHMIKVISDSSLEELISSPELLPKWIEEIFVCQKLFKPFLPPLIFGDEGSRGITFKIRKDNKTHGYLFGTFHYLITKELHEAAKLSGRVFNRLLKCAIIGTEIKIPDTKSSFGSVEENLMLVARMQGIVNFGIDSPIRNLYATMKEEKEKNEKSTEEIEEIKRYLAQTAKAYHNGDIEQFKALDETKKALVGDDKDDTEIETARDACMALNIDTILNIVEVVGKEIFKTLPKSFFAIGTEHLLREGPESIRSILFEKRWTLELVDERM